MTTEELNQLTHLLRKATRKYFDSNGDPMNLSKLEYDVLYLAQNIAHELYMVSKYPTHREKLKTGGISKTR